MKKDAKHNRPDKWRSLFEDTMAAASFAEANEHEYARQFINSRSSSRRSILLVYTDNEADSRTLNYASNLCKNMDCELNILRVFPKSYTASIDTELDELKAFIEPLLDVPWHLFGVWGETSKEVSRFVKEHGKVVSVVLKDSVRGGKKRRRSSGWSWWNMLNCPVVLVDGTAG